MQLRMFVGWVVGWAAVNWGLVGLLDVNLVEAIFGRGTQLTQLSYILTGIVGIIQLVFMFRLIKGGK